MARSHPKKRKPVEGSAAEEESESPEYESAEDRPKRPKKKKAGGKPPSFEGANTDI